MTRLLAYAGLGLALTFAASAPEQAAAQAQGQLAAPAAFAFHVRFFHPTLARRANSTQKRRRQRP